MKTITITGENAVYILNAISISRTVMAEAEDAPLKNHYIRQENNFKEIEQLIYNVYPNLKS